MFSFGCEICAGKVFHSWSVLAYKLRCEAGPHIDLLRVERKIKMKKNYFAKKIKGKNRSPPKIVECCIYLGGDRRGELFCKKKTMPNPFLILIFKFKNKFVKKI